MLKMLGVEYISYHACLNDCILYRDAYVDKERCQQCGCDRYQESKNKCKEHGPPHKILRHMPKIPRIQRLFLCKQLAEFQRWHASHWSEIGVMWIPANLIPIKHIKDIWPDKFKDELHSLQLSIAMDGVNPYSLQNTSYYVWLVAVINNNIPPWLSVKNEHLMLTLIMNILCWLL